MVECTAIFLLTVDCIHARLSVRICNLTRTQGLTGCVTNDKSERLLARQVNLGDFFDGRVVQHLHGIDKSDYDVTQVLFYYLVLHNQSSTEIRSSLTETV